MSEKDYGVTIGALQARIRQLEAALEDAVVDLSWWGEQSDRNIQEEFDLDGSVKYFRAVLEGKV